MPLIERTINSPVRRRRDSEGGSIQRRMKEKKRLRRGLKMKASEGEETPKGAQDEGEWSNCRIVRINMLFM